MQFLANVLVVEPESAQEMARRQRDQPRLRRQRLQHEFRRDLPQPLRLQRHHPHALRRQRLPRIDIRGIIVGITDHLVAFFPLQTVRDQIQAKRRRPEQRDLVAVRVDQPRADAADRFDLHHEIGVLLRVASPVGLVLQRLDRRPRQGRNTGMSEKNPLLRDGKEPMTQRFVGEDVVDAQIDLVGMFLHASKVKGKREK